MQNGAKGEGPVLTVLDPVDMASGITMPRFGDFLRERFQAGHKFRPLNREEMEKKLADFKWDPRKPCHEFQCGFDAGNVLLTEYVCFGTVTALPGLFAYTFNVLHVPTGQVVLSEVGEVPGNTGNGGEDPLKARIGSFASGVDPARLDTLKQRTRGLMAVVDLSVPSAESRIVAERVSTHAYASRHYDLMSQQELQELLTAMNIPLTDAGATDSALLALGARLNVAFLVQSRLSQDARGQKLDLALFDIPGRRRIRDWPSKPSHDFLDLLHFENRFFTTLMSMPGDPAQANGKSRSRGHGLGWKRAWLSMTGLSAAIGLGTMAYLSHQEANRDHGRAEASLGDQANALKQQTESEDRLSILYGSLSALSLGLSITLITF